IFKSQLGKRSADYATSLHNLGVAIWQNGSADAGYKYLKTAADIRRRVLGKNHPRYAETMLKLAEYQWHKKSIRNARESFGEVFRNYYFQIDETFPVLTEEEKTKFYYNNIREAFDKFNAMAAAVNPSQPGLIDDVFNYTINTTGAIMLSTEKVRTSILASGDSSLIAF